MHYFPIALPFLAAFWLLFAILIGLIQIGILQYAFESMGIGRRYMFTLLVLCLLGSYINIPVATLPPEQVESGQIVDFYGMRYIVPVVVNWPGTVLAVNVGGAVIPFILSIYLMLRSGELFNSVVAIFIVTLVVHLMARPVHGVGITVPMFIPPVVTAAVALSLSRRHSAPIAYIAGSLGTLLGADLLNLDKIRGMGAPVASIGGAGKFDGIFLTGIVAVLIASIFSPRRRSSTAW